MQLHAHKAKSNNPIPFLPPFFCFYLEVCLFGGQLFIDIYTLPYLVQFCKLLHKLIQHNHEIKSLKQRSCAGWQYKIFPSYFHPYQTVAAAVKPMTAFLQMSWALEMHHV